MRWTDQHWIVGAIALALSFAFSSTASAGTVEGGGGSCELGSTSPGCEWSPSHCSKPTRPHVFSGDAASYNRAVDGYNAYLDAQNRYLQCINADAKADVESKFPELVNNRVRKLSDDAQQDVKKAKADVDLARSQLHR